MKFDRKFLIAFGLLLPVCGGGLSLGLAQGHAVEGAVGIILPRVLRNPLSLFGQRSPGARLLGALIQTKPDLAPRLPRQPIERVLPKIRSHGTPPLRTFDIPQPPYEDLIDFPPESPTQVPFTVVVPFDVGTGKNFPPPDILAPDIPRLDLLPAAPAAPTDSTPTVPEPASWVMMIAGFFGIGAVMRRDRSKAHPVGDGGRAS